MSDKYIDFYPEIVRMSLPESDRNGIAMALHWLDAHRDQVPGRTITESKYRDTLDRAVKVSGYGDDWDRGFGTGLAVAGAKVVSDPEPTNAEKLVDDLLDCHVAFSEREVEAIAGHLDRRGWMKAPEAGGDDE